MIQKNWILEGKNWIIEGEWGSKMAQKIRHHLRMFPKPNLVGKY